MKIETINEILIDVVGKASKIITRNANQPILENIIMEVFDESTLRITAYNLDIFYTQDVFVKTINKDKYNKVCINPNVLLSYISLFDKNDNVYIEFLENSVKISIKNQESIIQTLTTSNYPDIKAFNLEGLENKDKALNVNSDILIDGIQSVSFSAAVSSIKPELSCVLISLDDDVLSFVATDGFRLVEKKKSVKKENILSLDDFKQILIPSKILNDLNKVLYSGVSVSLFISKNLFCIKTSESFMCVRTVSGLYPNYKNIIPKDFITKLEINTEDVVYSLKASNIFSDDFNYVKLDIVDGFINFYSKNNKKGESFSKKNIIKTGENITQNYNHKYLSDFINKIDSKELTIEISGKTTPTVIRPKGDNSYVYMVMPMNK